MGGKCDVSWNGWIVLYQATKRWNTSTKIQKINKRRTKLILNKVVSLGKLAGYDFDESDVRQLIEQLDSELKVKGKIDFRKLQDITGKSIVSFVIGISMIGVLKASNDLASHAFSYYLEKNFPTKFNK